MKLHRIVPIMMLVLSCVVVGPYIYIAMMPASIIPGWHISLHPPLPVLLPVACILLIALSIVNIFLARRK